MIERCSDYRRIKKYFENVWVTDTVYYLMEIRDGIDLGVWALEPVRGGLLIHARMGEGCRGRRAVESAKSAFKWVFENTDYRKIYAAIPNTKRGAQFVASWAGMQRLWARNGWCGYAVERV